MKLEAVFDSVIIKPVDIEDTMYGNIIVPDLGKEKSLIGEVVSVGPGKESITGEKFISPRVLPINQEKTDRRVSSIKEISKNYFKIISAKVDHSVDIAQKIKNIISNLC